MELSSFFSTYRVDAILFTNLLNVRYLSGFTGTNGVVLVTRKKKFFFTDFRYWEQAAKQVRDCTIVKVERDIIGTMSERLKDLKIKRLGVEAPSLPYAQFLQLKKTLRFLHIVAIVDDPGKLREVKQKSEITNLKKACAVNKAAFEGILPNINSGKSEIEIARGLEITLLKNGAEKIGFDTIVASGVRGALPHGVASVKKIKRGELITIDFGCVVNGYNSDETVTVALGKINRKQQEIWQIVYDAQRYAIETARPGIRCNEIDKAARDYITEKGYGKYFGHALGHGVGLEVHERPVLSAKSPDVLEEGMVFTIEPGIYIPKFGGVRIEDMFLCRKNDIVKLTFIDKNLRYV